MEAYKVRGFEKTFESYILDHNEGLMVMNISEAKTDIGIEYWVDITEFSKNRDNS